MSTDLYGIRILEVEPKARRIRMRVFVVYYDTTYKYHQGIPSDRSFFVRVLCDKDALGDDIAEDNRFSEPWIDRNAFRYVDRFVELGRRNYPVESYEDYSDFYYERGGKWKDEDRLVQADYDVYVTKEEYTAAFSVGVSWGTTSYPTAADELTAEDYPSIPDFGDVYRSLVPFPDREGEATVADELAFSADGRRLLATDNEGGYVVIDVESGDPVVGVEQEGVWGRSAGWTHDGRVAYWTGSGFVAQDVRTGASEPFAPFGTQASSSGERFLDTSGGGAVKILDRGGQVLYERPLPEDLTAWAAFDAPGDLCALHIEHTSYEIIDLRAGTSRSFALDARASSLALSPDGRYLLAATYERGFVVLRVEDGAVIRSWKLQGRISTAVAWSPDGRLAATSSCDNMGYRSEITLHRAGAEIEADLQKPLAVPPRQPRDITDVARLYLERTRGFMRGWASHLDNDLVDFHAALVRLDRDLDLVPHIREPHSAVLARAYEAIFAAERGDEEHARRALADAEDRLLRIDLQPWWTTAAYATLAVAHHLLGGAAEAEAALKLARADLGEEANFFQKRGALARALLWMGRIPEVQALIDGAASSHYVSSFQVRLLVDLVDAGEFDLLKRAWDAWKVSQDWTAREAIQRALVERGEHDRAAALGLSLPSTGAPPPAAEAEAEPPANSPERFAWLAARGRWEEVYALLSATKPTQREALYARIATIARERGDIDIAIDALRNLLCEDMNSPGLRALQAAFRGLAGPASREYHL